MKVIASKNQLKDFSAIQGYLDLFKNCYGIQFKTFHGQGGSLSESIIIDWADKMRTLIVSYRTEDIYNWDENALFYTQRKNAFLVSQSEAADKSIRGQKSDKKIITLSLGATMSGEKLPPKAIGNYKYPRGFKDARFPMD